jgi:hypothetical protein
VCLVLRKGNLFILLVLFSLVCAVFPGRFLSILLHFFPREKVVVGVKVLVTGCLILLEDIYIYIYHMIFSAYVVVSFITFFHILLFPFFIILYKIHVLYASA